MSNTKHNELPWHWEPEAWSDGRGIAICCKEGPVAIIDPEIEASEEDKANADFICLACNSHYLLLQACRCALADLEGLIAALEEMPEPAVKTIEELKSAIAAAEGEK